MNAAYVAALHVGFWTLVGLGVRVMVRVIREDVMTARRKR